MNNLLKYFSKEELQKITNMDNLYLKAKVIVEEIFKEKVDKSGKPYIGHLYRVSGRLNDEIEKVSGLLHDTLEDTDITEKDLFEAIAACKVAGSKTINSLILSNKSTPFSVLSTTRDTPSKKLRIAK